MPSKFVQLFNMKFTPWKTLSSRVLVNYRKWDYVEDEVELPNGKQITYQYIKSPGSVTIVALNDAGQLIVVHEYRYLLNDDSLELPAGMIDEGMTPLETAHKELAEEVGLKAKTMECVGKAIVATGSVQGMAYVFLAGGLTPTEQALEETEQIEVFTMSPEAFDRAVAEGKVMASHVLIAWALARHRILPRL